MEKDKKNDSDNDNDKNNDFEKKKEKNHNNNDSDVDNDVKRNADNISDIDTNSCVSVSRSSWGSTVVNSIYTDDLATMGSCPQ